MVILHHKLWRDLRALREQMITIALIVCTGIAVLISCLSTYHSLHEAQRSFYRNYQFADIFVTLRRAPQAYEQQLAALPGVSRLETRLVLDGRLYRKQMTEPMVGRFISLPDTPSLALNQLHLVAGHWPHSSSHEVVINESFAIAQKLKPGDPLTAIVNGHQLSLTIAGIALSPEYIYAISADDLLPNDRHFGILWMNHTTLEAIGGMQDAFNNILVKTLPGYPEQQLMTHLRTLLQPYGVRRVFAQQEQVSHRFISNEMKQLKIFATIIPLIFLSVTTFLLHMILKRLIAIQRPQIAIMKSLGFTNSQISFYYLQLVLIIVMVGVILGIMLGYFSGLYMKQLYAHFFHFPSFKYLLAWHAFPLGIGLSFIAAIAGALNSIREILILPAAVALHAAIPAAGRKTFLDQWPFFRSLPTPIKLAARISLRTPLRTLFTILGITTAVSIMVLSLVWENALHHILQTQFKTNQRQTVTLTFSQSVPEQALTELQQLPGVLQTEGYALLPVRITAHQHRYQTNVIGLPAQPQLRQLVNPQQQILSVPAYGLLLNINLARKLNVKPGDSIYIQKLEGDQKIQAVPVQGIVNDYIGLLAYASIDFVNQLLHEDRHIRMANVLLDKTQLPAFYEAIKNIPRIATVAVRSQLIRIFEQTYQVHILVFTYILTAYALFIAVGVIYNSIRIALEERTTELATLRVLGFSLNEVFKVFLGELILQLLCAIPLGFLVGHGLAAWVIHLLRNDFFTVPLVVAPSTYLIATATILAAAVFSALVIRRKINQFNLVDTLKVMD